MSGVPVVILAGGFGTRLAEETEIRPKPMVEVGGRPILWHILKHYDSHGFRDFLVALGYKGEAIKRYFLDYAGLSGSLRIDTARNTAQPFDRKIEDWTLRLVETGLRTQTGGRLRRLREHLDGTFLLTYGDGVSNVDLGELLAFHKARGRIATVTAVHPPARFGALEMDGDRVVRFAEKPQLGEGWINGGFMAFEPAIFDHLHGDDQTLEAGTLEKLAGLGQLAAFRHDGFWQCMDTARDKRMLEEMWERGDAPWKAWS